MNPDLLHILQHALGLDEHGLYKGAREGYRNYFVTDGDAADGQMCRQLVALGLMREHPPRDWLPGSTFVVTAAGRDAVREHSPPAPKLTRSQRRYRSYIASDSGLKFGEWLKRCA